MISRDPGTGVYAVSHSSINVIAAAASIAAGLGGGRHRVQRRGRGRRERRADEDERLHRRQQDHGRDRRHDRRGAAPSAITATIAAASVAIGGGAAAGVAASIGLALAWNLIGWQFDGTPATSEVRAYVLNSTIDAGGNLSVTAIAGQKISALVFAGSVAIGAAAGVGIAATGSGVYTQNRIAVTVRAAIDGDNSPGIAATGISADQITLTATDTSTITAYAGAVSLAGAFAGVGAVAFSIGVSIAQNEIGSRVEAYIANAATFAKATVGGISITASEDATINALSAAASAALAIAGIAGIAISGAGAVATNVILTRTNAYAADSVLSSVGNVTVSATDNSSIHAIVLAVSVAVGGAVVGVGASIGIAIARNLVGWDPNAYDYTSSMVLSSGLAVGKRVLVVTGALAGSVFQYKGGALSGTVDLNAQTGQSYTDTNKWTRLNAADYTTDQSASALTPAVGATPGTKVRIVGGAGAGDVYEFVGAARVGPIDLRREQYGDASMWKQVNVVAGGAEVQAYLLRSSVNTSAGDLKLTALGTQTIDAFVFSGSVALSAGLVGGALSGAGVGVVNKIAVRVKAFIDGTKTGGINARSVTLLADDASTITSTAGTASVAAAFGAVAGLAISIAITVAHNEISNDVAAYIANATHGVTTTVGAVKVSAVSQGRRLFDLTTLNASQLDDAATVDVPDARRRGRRRRPAGDAQGRLHLA